jgi:Ca-activated chloride channel family protein
MNQPKDYYSLLGLPRNASAEDIRQSYFEAARRYHPDKNLSPGETEIFLDVQRAYEVLSNPKQRAKYDLTLAPEKTPVSPVNYRLNFSRQYLIRFKEPQLVYSILEIFPLVESKSARRPTMNLCLVLDHSTSMQGRNMEVVKDTAIQIIRMIEPTDIFSVIAFSDRAVTVVPASRGAELSKMESRIRTLLPSGGTEIFPGLEMGFNEVVRNVDHASVNHIILITDGQTYGDEQKCLDLAQRAADHGIGISGVGIGSEWNDRFLDALASATGGSTIYVTQPAEIQKALMDKFSSLGRTYAEETRLEFTVPDGVVLRYVFRLMPELGELSTTSPILLGPVIQNSRIRVLMEFMVQPQLVMQDDITLMDGKIDATLPDDPVSHQLIPLELTRPVTEGVGTELPPVEVVDALSRLKLYRLQEQARLEVTAGEVDHASEHLQHLAVHLLAQGERDLARTALKEAQNVQQEKAFSQQGQKELKYGTRALLSPGRSTGEQ